jgi:hypothetical protein
MFIPGMGVGCKRAGNERRLRAARTEAGLKQKKKGRVKFATSLVLYYLVQKWGSRDNGGKGDGP